MEKHRIEYANRVIDFQIKRKKVKNVNLHVKPDLTVEVTANDSVPLDFITDFVQSKGHWILKHVGDFQEVQPLQQREREYVSGEAFHYLGKQVRLRVRQTTEEEKVKFVRGFFYLYVREPENRNRKEKLINQWYREKAQIIFHESLEKIYPLVQKYGIAKPEIKIRLMKSRWGSALFDQGIILLNLELIKAPKYCIDYVILHELIHFQYSHHGEKFYQMLAVLMPDWEKRKTILDEEVVKEL
jgi:predicted metal-dependent hydrolase